MSEYMVSTRKMPPVYPGLIIKEDILTAINISITECARRINVSRRALYNIFNGSNALTAEIALKIARLTGNEDNAKLWLNMQQAYDIWRVKQTKAKELDKIGTVYEELL